jgi:hypothetical protein
MEVNRDRPARGRVFVARHWLAGLRFTAIGGFARYPPATALTHSPHIHSPSS